MSHPMLASANHDETTEQLFVRDLQYWLYTEVEPHERQIAEELDPGLSHNARAEEVFDKLHKEPAFLGWSNMRRTTQELLWDSVWNCVDRQAGELDAKASEAAEIGSLTLAEDFQVPDYLEDAHVHLMPGGYGSDTDGVRQGALMDRGGAVYMLGRNGGFLNDGRGKAVAAHLASCYPDFQPEKLVELGCGVGSSVIPVAEAYPKAEAYAVDVGASVLRYAHARAAHLGAAIHFVQDDAEKTRFADESFDLVFTAAVMHETSPEAIQNILTESHRLLRKGGIAVHLEVPVKYETLDLWSQVIAGMERDYNNEPAWQEATSADYGALMTAAGFEDVKVGFQDAVLGPDMSASKFGEESKGVFLSWFVTSGRK
ncbi:class I SAM-dependent methyltransferase [Novosphingobium decolorationis]|uniref:Class I SAM-dependent methyltransferase n=1 Tax=Novosphingobium decolorationis TaxID=2698673 RepID=A0ABX8E7D1_9SPHN|nr:class I SAM-dependent methyltransferase [Novosphingobium decolorationis]QVM84499.1 class I SAM-dependent methyltransferase [Novosphingobium decolorationis]